MSERPSPPTDGRPSGEIDFRALVEDHNVARASDGADGAPGNGPAGSGLRARFARLLGDGSSRWWRIGYPLVIGLVLLIGVPLLVFTGLRVILDSTDGQLVRRVTDPAAPGYEAVVTKTPTALVAIVGPDNTLSGAALLALTSDNSGGVLTIPATLAFSSAFGYLPLSVAWQNSGIDGVTEGVGSVLNLSFTDRIVVRSSEWPALLATVGPLNLTLPDPVRDAQDAQLIAKGAVQVRPEQIAALLDAKSPSESELNRTLRQELFWKAWIGQLRTSGAAFPGPVDSGLGLFVASLARGQLSIAPLPVNAMPPAPPFPQRYAAVPEPAADSVASIVPFPEGAPGSRPRLRVLDGTGSLGNGLTAAIQLNAGGGQVDVVGNAKAYGQATTQIIYFEGTSEATAQKMRDAIDMGELVASKQSNSASDITVVLGEDYLARYGPTSDVTSPNAPR